MANKIILKKSSVAAKVPLSTDLEVGELAVNLADAKLYSKDSSGTVIEVGGGGGGAGDVVGPASATDNALARYDGTTGKLIQNGNITQDDNGNLANVNSVGFDTTPSTPPTAAGSVYWDSDYGTAAIVMGGGNVIQQVGEDQYYFGKNQTGSSIAKGTVVRANGTLGASGRILITPAIGDNSVPPEYFMGVTAEAIANGADGVVQWFGSIKGVNTTGQGGETWADGDVLYLSPTTAGALTNVEPAAPYQKTIVALVIYAAANGTIFVRPTIGHTLEEVNNVNINTPASGNTLIYDAASGYWKNANLTDGTGITITEGAGSITIANAGVTSATAGTGITVSGSTGSVTITNSDRGSSQNIFKNVAVSGQSTIVADSNNDTLTVAAGTGVSLATNATTDTLTITNTAPDQTVSIASGSGISATGTYPSFTVANTGVLSLTGTANEVQVSASTGAVTISLPATINASTTGSAATLTTARTIQTNLASTSAASFNGSANITPGVTGTLPVANGGTGATNAAAALTSLGAYPATNPNGYTSNTGTVTSVGLSAPTGLTVSGSPVTGSGTLALTYTAGYSIPTTASQTNWNTAYTDRLKWDGGSTGLTASTGRTSLGATTLGSNLFTIANPSAVTFPRFNADNTVSSLSAANFRTAIGAGTGNGTVTSVTGTSPVASSGGATPAISLASGYGDTQNPYASKTANFFLAAPNGTAGAPTFRAIVAADIPTLNQNTTGSAATLTTSRTIRTNLASTSTASFNGSANITPGVTGTLPIGNGGTGATTAATARTNLGATTVGSNFFTLTNPGAIRFPRMNADNTVSSLTAADFRTAIGAGTGSGTVTSVAASAGTGISVSGSPITTSGTLTITNTGVTSAVAGTGISVSGATGAVTVTNSDRGSSQAIFKNVAVSGQSTIVADSNNDTLTVAAGTGITLTTNAATDTLTIASNAATTVTYTTTLNTTWTGTSAPYSKTQSVSGILSTDNPIVDVVMSGTFATDEGRATAWSGVYRITTATDSITIYAFEKPLVELPIQLKVIR